MGYTKGKCKCEVDRYNILHRCPLHEAAPDMYEALQGLLKGNEVYHSNKKTGYTVAPSPDAVRKGIEAIAEVEK